MVGGWYFVVGTSSWLRAVCGASISATEPVQPNKLCELQKFGAQGI